MTEYTELIEGETYIKQTGRGTGGHRVTVTDVGMEFVEVEQEVTVGRRQETETEVYDIAEAQTTFEPV